MPGRDGIRGIDQRVSDLFLRINSPDPADPTPREDSFSLGGRTRKFASDVTGRAVNLIYFGQSTNNNSISGGTYTQTHPNNVFDIGTAAKGAMFLASPPLLNGDLILEHHGRWVADSLIDDNKVDSVILTMSACGGSYCADWAPGGGVLGNGSITLHGSLAYRIGLSARTIAAAGLSGVRNIIDWQQGEADTDVATTQTEYVTTLNKVIQECKVTGLLIPGKDIFVVNLCTRITGGANRTAIRAAQTAATDGSLIRLGGDIDTLDSSFRYDGTHFNFATGAAAQANLKKVVYEAWL